METMSRHTYRRLACLAGLAAAAVMGASFSAPAQAEAACGQTRTARPSPYSTSNRPPLVIGDSVLYDVVRPLARKGFEANGMICRTMAQGLAIMERRRARKTLPHMVILELGANGRVTTGDIQAALKIVGPGRVLVMLTPTDDDPPRGIDAQVIKASGVLYSKRMIVLDWAGAVAANPAWVARDGVHLAGQAGMDGLVNLIVKMKPWAPDPPLQGGALPAPASAGPR